jgi:hypothetical protein
MKLTEFLEAVGGDERDIVRYETEAEALEAVKQDGDALRFVDIRLFENDRGIRK